MQNDDDQDDLVLHGEELPPPRPQPIESSIDPAPAILNPQQGGFLESGEGGEREVHRDRFRRYHPPPGTARASTPPTDQGTVRTPGTGGLLRILTSLASSGVVERFDYDVLDMEDEGAQEGASMDHAISLLEELVPGLTRGEIRTSILQKGEGTAAVVAASIPGELGSFSTTVDGRGCVTGARVEKVTGAAAGMERWTHTIPGGVRDAVIEFYQDGGAREIVSKVRDGDGDGDGDEAVEGEEEKWMQVVSSSFGKASDQLAAAFMFEPALPVGTIVTKIRGGKILILGDYYGWEVIEMLIRFTAMFFLYAILVILFFGLIYPDENGSATPGSITFLILASNQRGNLSFYVSFLFQIIFIYVAIFSLRRARRVGRMLALRQVMPVKGFQLCLAMGRRAKSSGLMETLEAALREGGVNVWTSSSYVQNAEKRGRQIMHAVSRSCFQLIVLSPDLICSSSDCVHILEALRGPRSRSIFYLDRSADWLASIHGRTLEANHVDRMEEALRRLGFRVVSCPKLLLQLIDSLYLHPEEGSEEEALLTQWWASSPPAYSSFTLPTSLSYGICSSRTGSTVSLCGLQGHVNFSFSGKLFPPSHSLRNGWFYLAKSSISSSSSSSSSSRSSPPLTRSDDVELTPAPLASSFSSQTQRTQVHFELGRMFGVSWLGLAVLLFEVCIGGFILLGPYCGDTFSSYSRIFGSQYGTCQLTGLGLSYQPPLFSPANFTAAEVVVGTCWATFQDAGAPAEFPPPSYVCKGCLSGRLLTSNELPLFLIAEEFRRMDLSLHVFTDSHGQALETLSPLVSFLESCGLRVAVASDLAHAAASPDFFVLFLTDSESAADYWKERHRFDSARHLLVVSSRALGSTPQLLDLEVLVVEEEVFLHRFNQNLIAKTAVYIHKRSLRAGIPT
ncbi:hypothetical protein GUITHDRAFT_107928 [Guillardia theta CCMP2712]|uniref:TIR domain-containing protein n=2 Tax=Guillardia theta TaxID=55529 RepID=L1JE05_GUITC|nr:hypothetical protein GUITHDRAFT_107928 [Guillardia theta CCMP2712]EKX46320.1 hypothetical protein GUITHDRAFT_107928 [Guillardia theta CCMP2712]|eukprot:XP_005833300.1 hypothetical protein GUITHDRAFT_107928 [Guillardia theta CCMP2712]